MNPTDYSLFRHMRARKRRALFGLWVIASVGRHTLRAYRTGFRYTFDLPGARRLCGALSFFYGWNQKIAAQARPESPKKDAQRDESHS